MPLTRIGLAENEKGVPFQCGTCRFFSKGVCHKGVDELLGRPVERSWCCNAYEHPDMRVIVK